MSTAPALAIASRLGLHDLAGRKLDNLYRASGINELVSADREFWENEPSMAVNPLYPSIVVVFNHYYNETTGGPCRAHVSWDGGETFNWNDWIELPLPSGTGDCSDPVVRFSPDGMYTYYFYMDVYQVGNSEVSDIIMQRAEGTDPTTLVGLPVKVFDANGTNFYDKEWGDVHPHDYYNSGGNAGVVYATATLFDAGGGCSIVFNASYDYGVSWQYDTANPLVLDTDADCNPVLQGSRPIGGNNNFMMACWYDSHSDGYLGGKFNITCRAHDNLGSPSLGTWSDYFYPFLKQKYEVSEWLGPYDKYHRWRATMFPVLAVDEEGMVYVATVADDSSSTNTEAGNIYVGWAWLDYTVSSLSSWTKQAVDTSGGAQGFPTMVAHYSGTAKAYKLLIAYNSYMGNNKYYKIVYRVGTRKKAKKTMSFSTSSVVLSDRRSQSDYYFIGDYIDSATDGRNYHVVWTDRSDAYNKYDADDDVLHAVIPMP
ncbi:MAG: hypothetical protein D6770_03925 [Anaerolineae bacterium]|nr:MAG: hypothetical protein D6770_03925 [Anaerolineae bacterium]